MAFKFRLQAVLDIAQRLQDQKAQALAEAQARHQSELARLHSVIQDQERKRLDLLEVQQAGVLDLQSIQWGLDYLGILATQEVERREEVTKAQEAIDEARKELMIAAQKVQVLEKLKARVKDEYQHKLDKVEAALIDELSTQRYSWNDSGPSARL